MLCWSEAGRQDSTHSPGNGEEQARCPGRSPHRRQKRRNKPVFRYCRYSGCGHSRQVKVFELRKISAVLLRHWPVMEQFCLIRSFRNAWVLACLLRVCHEVAKRFGASACGGTSVKRSRILGSTRRTDDANHRQCRVECRGRAILLRCRLRAADTEDSTGAGRSPAAHRAKTSGPCSRGRPVISPDGSRGGRHNADSSWVSAVPLGRDILPEGWSWFPRRGRRICEGLRSRRPRRQGGLRWR